MFMKKYLVDFGIGFGTGIVIYLLSTMTNATLPWWKLSASLFSSTIAGLLLGGVVDAILLGLALSFVRWIFLKDSKTYPVRLAASAVGVYVGYLVYLVIAVWAVGNGLG